MEREWGEEEGVGLQGRKKREKGRKEKKNQKREREGGKKMDLKREIQNLIG